MMVDTLAQEVEKEKIKAIGTRNLIKSMAKQREAMEKQYHVCKIIFLHKCITVIYVSCNW